MEGRDKRQPERPDYAEAVEPRCPECGEPLVIEYDERLETTNYRCPSGNGDEEPLSGEHSRAVQRERTGELGEDR